MSLPVYNTPVYNLTMPSSGKIIKFRPFLVKEEKALLIAQQSEDASVMIDTLKQVIKACVKDSIDVDTMPTFDLEYVFVQIRAKSVGEIVELMLRCNTCDDPKAVSRVSVDLTQLEVIKTTDNNPKIDLFDDVGIMFKFPTMKLLSKLEVADITDIDSVIDVIADCVDYIYNSSEVFHAKEQTKEELVIFLNNLNSKQFAKIQKFFETLPRLKCELNFVCPICSVPQKSVLEGLNSFF